MKNWTSVAAVAATTLVCAVQADAQVVSIPRGELDIPFSVGSGNSNTNFAIARNPSQSGYIELGMKAKQRYAGDANVGGSGFTYVVPRGYSQNEPAGAPAGAWWNFDLSVNLGNRSFENTIVYLRIMFNGSQLFEVNSDQLGATGSIMQASENIGFASLGYDPNALGTYTFELEARDKSFPVIPIAIVAMQTVVVPLPTTAGLAIAGLGLMGLRRRR